MTEAISLPVVGADSSPPLIYLTPGGLSGYDFLAPYFYPGKQVNRATRIPANVTISWTSPNLFFTLDISDN